MDITDRINAVLEHRIFSTFDEASAYLKEKFNGHGSITHYPSGKLLVTCKCSHRSPDQRVYCKEDLDPFESLRKENF